jgi:hypothetical protein
MPDLAASTCTAFEGNRLLLSGSLLEVALAVKSAIQTNPSSAVLVFDDATGRVIDLDLRGTKADIAERLSRARSRSVTAGGGSEPKGRGRPRLGVIAREVTLLPRQWEWLAAQPNGASAALRRLVDEARRNGAADQQRRAAREAAYRFMLGIGGDLPGYEEGTRALFADDPRKLRRSIAPWPKDIRAHVLRLALGAKRSARPARRSQS